MPDKNSKSPQIKLIGWGKMEVERFGPGKDFKLWPGGCSAWDWRETGTTHLSGVQIAEVEALIKRGCEVIIIGRGILSRLRVPKETIHHLKAKEIKVYTTNTRKAVQIYNTYAESGIPTGGLFHSTC